MAKQNDDLREACSKLRETLAKNQIRLDAIQKELELKSKKPSSTISNLQIQQAGPIAAFETRKQVLASMQEGLKVSDCQPNCKLQTLKFMMVVLQNTNFLLFLHSSRQ
jgi:hypothetical protein